MKCLRNFIIVIVIIAAAFIAYIYSGAYGVNATGDNWGPVDWVLRTVSEHSIDAAAANVQVPDDLASDARIRAGAKHYAAMCAVCHLAPGMDDTEVRQGLNPRPPQLYKFAQYIDPKVAFWVIRNGVRMTAMPAWGPTHGDNDIWDIVAFVKTLSKTSPAQYKALTAGAEQMEEHEHEHAQNPGAHQQPPPVMHPSTRQAPHSLTPPPATRQPPQSTPPPGGSSPQEVTP